MSALCPDLVSLASVTKGKIKSSLPSKLT